MEHFDGSSSKIIFTSMPPSRLLQCAQPSALMALRCKQLVSESSVFEAPSLELVILDPSSFLQGCPGDPYLHPPKCLRKWDMTLTKNRYVYT